MKIYLLSLGAGVLVGVIYGLLNVRSPAPPIVALIGLLGIETGQLADLIVPDKDFFSCAEDELSHLSSDLTMVGGKVVYSSGDFADLDENPFPPAMPDWSPVRTFGGYGAWGHRVSAKAALRRKAMSMCGCRSGCDVHGHDHARAWSSDLPVGDLKGFFGALGCACWAV